jgi:hypothetical protein
MRRCDFISFVTALPFASAAADAQEKDRIYRVGSLHPSRRNADIERVAGAACKGVYIELSHAPSVQNRDGRDKPGHDIA